MTKKTNTVNESSVTTSFAQETTSSVSQDFKHSVLIVSVLVNLYIFTAWIALQVTTRYDEQLASFLFNR
jgi:hypothetical protein